MKLLFRSNLIQLVYFIILRSIAQMRIFKSREILRQTRRKYQKLPEIVKRQQTERDQKIRRNHQILVNMFNKVGVLILFVHITFKILN